MFRTAVGLIHPGRAKPFHRDGWIYEEKFDGWRIAVFKDGSRVRLVSRIGRDHAARFPEVVADVTRRRPRTLYPRRRGLRVRPASRVAVHLLMDLGDEP